MDRTDKINYTLLPQSLQMLPHIIWYQLNVAVAKNFSLLRNGQKRGVRYGYMAEVE